MQRLTEAFPIGKVIKIKWCFYKVTAITLEVVLKGKWLDTDVYIATINVKPYRIDMESDNEL